MRVSLFSVDLRSVEPGTTAEDLQPIADVIAKENVTCCFLQGVRQRAGGATVPDTRSREDNTGVVLQRAIAHAGVRLELFWRGTEQQEEEMGCALLSQLPILAGMAAPGPEGTDAEIVVVARLALGLHASLDAYSVMLNDAERLSGQFERLVTFINQTPEFLESQRPPRPKRRGPTRRYVVPAEKRVESRVICVGVSGAEPAEADVRGPLRNAHFLELTSGLSESESAGGASEDMLFVRPGIRAIDARRLFSAGEVPLLGNRSAVLVETEL